MYPEEEVGITDETREKEVSIDIEELRKEIRKEFEEKQGEIKEKVRFDESTEKEGFKEIEISKPPKGDLAKLSELELFVIKFILDNTNYGGRGPSKDDAIKAITFSFFGTEHFENDKEIVLKTFNSLYGGGLVTSASSSYFEVSQHGRSSYQNYNFDSIYDKIKSDAQNKIKTNDEWLESALLIKKSSSSHLFIILNKELINYGISYLFEKQICLMDFFFENKDIEERLEYTEQTLNEKITNNLNSIMNTGDKIYLFKLFAHKIIDCDNKYQKYNHGQEERSKIVVEHPEIFSKLYIFSVDNDVTDIFSVGDKLKQMTSEEEVISAIYDDPCELIKDFDFSYNKWNRFFNDFKEEMVGDFKDIILADNEGYVHIPKFWKDKIMDLFFGKNEKYLELLIHLSQTKTINDSHKKFCDLLVTKTDICLKPQEADEFFEKYYPEYYDKITKRKNDDDLRIKYEPIIKEFIKDNLTTEDIKTYYHLRMIDEFGEIREDKDTIINRFFNKESIKKLGSIHFFSPDEGSSYLTPLASSDTISYVINDIYSGSMFKEELLSEIDQKFTTLTEQEKALLVLIIMPESLDSGIKIKLKDTGSLFSTQVLATEIGGQRFDELKKEFYILKTKEGLKSSIKPHIKNIFDSIDLDNLPYVLFERSKEETEKDIDDIFKSKSPSYFYRLLKGELNESEVIELGKCGLILSDGNNNPIIHPALKDVFKEKWREHWNNLDNMVGENIIKEAEDKDKKIYGMKCNIETFKCFANPYMNIDYIGNDWVQIEIVDKNLDRCTIRLDSINFEKTILISEELELNEFSPEEESGKEALMKGLSAIELNSGRIYSANESLDKIAKTIENQTGKEIRVPGEYFSILHELKEKVKEKKAEKLHEKAKKARAEKTEEKEKEIERIDELWQEIFFDKDEIILFEPDQYLNGKLKTFTYLVHGLPGCGKTTLIERQTNLLKNKIEEKLNWKTPIHYLSIKEVLDRRLPPVDFSNVLFSEILRFHKPAKDETGRPGIIIIQDLDAIAEQKIAPTSDVKEGQKIGIIIKDFLKEIFEKQEYQLAVFAEATNLNNIPEYLLQFFPNRKVVLAPDTKGRKEIFDRVRADRIKERLKGENPDIVKELIDIIGLPITQNEGDLLSQHTQGFTYRDLVVLIRDFKQNIKEDRDEKDLIKLIEKYEPSLPQYLRIEVPDVDWDDVKGLDEQKQKVKDALLIIDEDIEKENLNINPAKGLLFYGVPGTGKTFLAKAIAKEGRAFFIHLTPPQIFSKYFGESEQNLKHIFTLAKELSSYGDQNVIIFIDELDGFAPSREKIESRPERSVLSVLLSELDGLEELKKVTIIGTTNRPWDVDAALIRSGRFDEWIEFNPPDFDTCVEILHSSLNRDKVPVPEINDIKNILKDIKDEIYDSQKEKEYEEDPDSKNGLLVPADLNSFANRIARSYAMHKDKTVLERIKDNLSGLIKEKELRRKWIDKSKK